MSTKHPNPEQNAPVDFLNKSKTELTEQELKCVSGGKNCCAGVHYQKVVLAMRKAG